jgi:glycerate-2-kinase
MINGVTAHDLVLVLISGGGSSLLCLPHDMNYDTLVQITKALTKKGADIYELNTVRKHFSEIQGGGLAKLCFPAQVVSLIFSDVLGNDLGMIASGPTVYDKTTVADAAKVLLKYEVLDVCVAPDCQFLETPKHPKYFASVKNTLVCSNREALLAMKARAEELGFHTSIETETLSGNALEVGKMLAQKEPQKKRCLLFGGETTVKVGGKGVGGRNQELALSALPLLPKGAVLAAVASDGWDNTDHAGALVDSYLLEEASRKQISPTEYLANNDSYNFFKKVGGAICTGRLGSNVSDLYILIYE